MANVTAVHSPALHAPAAPLVRDLAAGALAGQVAGLVMAAVVMLVFWAILGTGPLFPVQVIGSVLFGDAALHGFHLPALLAGLVLHQAGPSLAWGLAFGALAHALQPRRAGLVALGLAVGVVSQLLDVGLVVPAAMRALQGRDLWAEHVPAFWSWAAHVVFGLSLAFVPWGAARPGPTVAGDVGVRPARVA